jgi:spermidine synthase
MPFVIPMNKTHLAEGKYHRFESLGIPLSDISFWNALWNGSEIIERRIGSTKLLYYGEGIGGFTTVMEETDILGNRRLYMANSGKIDASSHGDIYTQAMLGHLPALIHSRATNALVIGFGCGMTSGELLHYPGVMIDSVEISPQVIEAAMLFNEWNNEVLSSPRNRTIIQDARTHLMLGDTSYDIITAEPSNPWMAGLANLFTREYMELVKSRLTDDGIFIQFLHSYQIDWKSLSLIMRTISKVFPDSVMIRPAYWGSDYALVCFKNPDQHFDIDVIRKNLARASVSSLLRIEVAEVIYPLIVNENVVDLAGPGPLHTDNLPILETWAPRNMFLGGQDIDQKIDEQKVLSDETQNHLNAFTNQTVQLAFARYLASGNQSPFLVMDPAQTDPDLWAKFIDEIRAFAAANPIFDYQTIPDDLVGEVAGVQEPLIRAALLELAVGEFMDRFRASSSHAALASMYQRAGRMDDVARSYTRMVMLNPEDDALKGNLAMLYYAKGQMAETLELLAMMKSGRDWRHTLITSHGLVMLGRTPDASRAVLAALKNDPQKELYDRYIEFLRGADQGEAADQFISEWEQVVQRMNH